MDRERGAESWGFEEIAGVCVCRWGGGGRVGRSSRCWGGGRAGGSRERQENVGRWTVVGGRERSVAAVGFSGKVCGYVILTFNLHPEPLERLLGLWVEEARAAHARRGGCQGLHLLLEALARANEC